MSTTTDKGYSMHVLGGDPFFPLSATEFDMDLDSIAHGLSHLCRYNGHSKHFYSVAQHAWIMSFRAEDEALSRDKRGFYPVQQGMRALHHDDPEAYIGDIIYPLKRTEHFEFFNSIDNRLEKEVEKKFQIPDLYNDIISLIDRQMIYSESASFGPVPVTWENDTYKRPDEIYRIVPVPSKIARYLYKSRHKELVDRRNHITSGTAKPLRCAVRQICNRLAFKVLAGTQI